MFSYKRSLIKTHSDSYVCKISNIFWKLALLCAMLSHRAWNTAGEAITVFMYFWLGSCLVVNSGFCWIRCALSCHQSKFNHPDITAETSMFHKALLIHLRVFMTVMRHQSWIDSAFHMNISSTQNTTFPKWRASCQSHLYQWKKISARVQRL